MKILEIEGLSKRFDGRQIFDGFDLELEEGEILEVRGESGIGKTTLLRCIADLEDFSGEIFVDGKLSYMFQESRILPWLNVRKNLLMPVKLERRIEEEDRERMEELCEKFSVKEHLDDDIEEVSGGEMQRLLLVRALLNRPDLLLLDEPFNSLDTETREGIYSELISICEEEKIAVIVASHKEDLHRFTTKRLEI